jgi:hypothetical protein
LFSVLFSSDCCNKGFCFVLKFKQLILIQKRMLQLYFHSPIYVCFYGMVLDKPYGQLFTLTSSRSKLCSVLRSL